MTETVRIASKSYHWTRLPILTALAPLPNPAPSRERTCIGTSIRIPVTSMGVGRVGRIAPGRGDLALPFLDPLLALCRDRGFALLHKIAPLRGRWFCRNQAPSGSQIVQSPRRQFIGLRQIGKSRPGNMRRDNSAKRAGDPDPCAQKSRSGDRSGNSAYDRAAQRQGQRHGTPDPGAAAVESGFVLVPALLVLEPGTEVFGRAQLRVRYRAVLPAGSLQADSRDDCRPGLRPPPRSSAGPARPRYGAAPAAYLNASDFKVSAAARALSHNRSAAGPAAS